MKKLVWILEPNSVSALEIKRSLASAYELRVFNDLESLAGALENSATLPFAMIADPYLPEGSALEFIRSRAIPRFPCLFVSGNNSLSCIEDCFEAGAYDYILKPFDRQLLLAKMNRLNKLLTENRSCTESGLTLDFFTNSVEYPGRGREVLTPKEFRILLMLEQAFPDGVPRRRLFQEIWGEVNVGMKTLDVHLFSLRRKLESLNFEIRIVERTVYHLLKLEKDGRPETPITSSECLQAPHSFLE